MLGKLGQALQLDRRAKVQGSAPTAKAEPAPVTLHIYDLGQAFQGVNALGRAVGTGAFHAGVEVHGKEWSFSCVGEGPHKTGIFWVKPRSCTAHVYREAVFMGKTELSKSEVDEIITKLTKEWPAKDYDLLRHNCCHFSDTLCKELGVGPVPSWVTSLAGAGAVLRSGARLVAKGAAAAPQMAYNGAAAALDLLLAPRATDEAELAAELEAARARVIRPKELAYGGFKPGDEVEIFSNSSQAWCPGHVESLGENGALVVTFSLPGAATGELSTKLISAGHQHLRRPAAAFRKPPLAAAQVPYAEGHAVEVYSNSHKAWCQGRIEAVNGRVLQLAFLAPGAAAGEWSRKELPIDHKDLRRPPAATPATGALVAQAPPPAGDLGKKQNAPADLNIGDWVEVFSEAAHGWVLGRVTKMLAGAGVTAAFQLPGRGPDEWVEKQLLPESPNLRKAAAPPPGPPPPQFTSWEEATYGKFFGGLLTSSPKKASGLVDARAVAEFLRRSGLPRRVLKEIWSVGNPSGKDAFSIHDFSFCLRLVAKCQACLQTGDASLAEIFAEGGENLRLLMEWELMASPPAQAPQFLPEDALKEAPNKAREGGS